MNLEKKPLVVNLFGGPGTGKSTTAAGVFSKLKKLGINAELSIEFAKDLTWSQRHVALRDQIYIFGKQHHKLFILREDLDVIVTDSPLLLSCIYANNNYPECFHNTVKWAFDSNNNVNIFLTRDKPYSSKGRNQTESESKEIDREIQQFLILNNYDFYIRQANELGEIEIVNIVREIMSQ